MEVTAKLFYRLTLELEDAAADGKGLRHQMWVVPPAFYAVQNINDPRYLSGDVEGLESRD